MNSKNSFSFCIDSSQKKARAGSITTPHGIIQTPAFMPVATQGSVKSATPLEVKESGTSVVLTNTYHLYLRPGMNTLEQFDSIHTFMGWGGPILTDSGGFQALSLGNFRTVTDEGIKFKSHIDGSEHLLTPENSIKYQEIIGADIITCLDHCIEFNPDNSEVKQAMDRTHRWAELCARTKTNSKQALFGIIQGGHSEDLRQESTREIVGMNFDGYAIGGLSVGEPKSTMYDITELTTNLLPDNKVRYLMGVGSPEDLVECVSRGIDIFDCVLPTRVARNGALFTNTGRIDIKSQQFKNHPGPVDTSCECLTCKTFSMSYIHHLFKAKEMLSYRLATIHNLSFINKLMTGMRNAILENKFDSFKTNFLSRYKSTDESIRLSQKKIWMKARSGH